MHPLTLNQKRIRAYAIDLIFFSFLMTIPTIIAFELRSKRMIMYFIMLANIFLLVRDVIQNLSLGRRLYSIKLFSKKTNQPIGFLLANTRSFLAYILPIFFIFDFFVCISDPYAQKTSDRFLQIELREVTPFGFSSKDLGFLIAILIVPILILMQS
jgi:hypothetical protein